MQRRFGMDDLQLDTPQWWLHPLLENRRTTSPKRLVAPGPGTTEFAQIMGAAAHAPDHGRLTPWRFVEVPLHQRAALGQVFQSALAQRDPLATPEQLTQARQKAERAPLLLAAVVHLPRKTQPEVPTAERLISLGCALQNILLMATALGYASALTSGKALNHKAMRAFFRLERHHQLTCFVNIGTASTQSPARPRPHWLSYTSVNGISL